MGDTLPQTRLTHRRTVTIEARARSGAGRRAVVVLTDISESGCGIEMPRNFLTKGEEVTVRPEGLDSIEGCVRWVEERSAGISFRGSLHPAVVDHLARNAPEPEFSVPSPATFVDRFGRRVPLLPPTRPRRM